MSQLIQMRQRIEAIATIKKITHATRLIAMSAHTRLANQEPLMAHYKNEVTLLFERLLEDETDISDAIVQCSPTATQSLIILIGAQKGFCGTFNIALFKFLENHFATKNQSHSFIAIGKKAQDYLHAQVINPLMVCNNLSSSTVGSITTLITETIIKHAHEYKKIVIVSNCPRTFFSQKPQQTTLLPLQKPKATVSTLDAYYWPEPKQNIITMLSTIYLQSIIESLLFSSLAAEQAARFHSMDNATRNAKELLDTMYRDYNKLRQSKITQELLELSGSFQR